MKDRIAYFVFKQKFVPWRIKNRFVLWREGWLKDFNITAYKILKHGRRDLNTQKYWNSIWSTDNPEESRNYEEMYDKITELVPRNTRVLDVGCGVGLLLQKMRDNKRCDVVGLDISDTAINALKQLGMSGIVSTLPKIPFPDAIFDVVTATDVLEHLRDPRTTVKQMARVLRTGGLLIVSVPNNTLDPTEELEHLHCFSEEEITVILSQYAEVVYTSTGKYMDNLRADYLLVCAVKN